MEADMRVKAQQFVPERHSKRNEFDSALKKDAQAWESAKTRLEVEWKDFQSVLKNYIEDMSKQEDSRRTKELPGQISKLINEITGSVEDAEKKHIRASRNDDGGRIAGDLDRQLARAAAAAWSNDSYFRFYVLHTDDYLKNVVDSAAGLER
jgi:hypothetical protein